MSAFLKHLLFPWRRLRHRVEHPAGRRGINAGVMVSRCPRFYTRAKGAIHDAPISPGSVSLGLLAGRLPPVLW